MALATAPAQSRLFTRIRPAGFRYYLAGAQEHPGVDGGGRGDRQVARDCAGNLLSRASIFHRRLHSDSGYLRRLLGSRLLARPAVDYRLFRETRLVVDIR